MPTLLIMAAGLGSRYGGNKQVDTLGPHGEILMEYSIYDACQAGFDRVVFVIRQSMKDTFHEKVGEKIGRRVPVAYAFQEADTLPAGFIPPEGRVKPYGTVHAVLCARDVIHEPFAVINADDYYGREAFRTMADHLRAWQGREGERLAAMVGYELRNTVSPHGSVTRGVCQVDGRHHLKAVHETMEITLRPDGTIWDQAGDAPLAPDALVSMNFWGFTPAIFPACERLLEDFLRGKAGDPLKKEYPLPVMVDTLMQEGLSVSVLPTCSAWFGVTYREDRSGVAEALQKLHENGTYPERL